MKWTAHYAAAKRQTQRSQGRLPHLHLALHRLHRLLCLCQPHMQRLPQCHRRLQRPPHALQRRGTDSGSGTPATCKCSH